jgi:hypothetical protein
VSYLLGRGPELNPDEALHNEVKLNALGRRRPRAKTGMDADGGFYPCSTQKRPDIGRNYFKEDRVRDAT